MQTSHFCLHRLKKLHRSKPYKIRKIRQTNRRSKRFFKRYYGAKSDKSFKTSSKELIAELDKITDVSIESQAKRLAKIIADMTCIEGKKRYQTYFDLSKNLLEKNYTLLSLSLLYESIRLYVKSYTKSKHKEIVEKIEDAYNQDLYAIGDFFQAKKLQTRLSKSFTVICQVLRR